MKTMSEWTVKIVSEVEDYLDPLDALTEVLSKYLPMIQQDAVRHAQTPDLPEGVPLSEERVKEIRRHSDKVRPTWGRGSQAGPRAGVR